MIVSCPSCKARYNVNAEQVPLQGARMRCTKCEHSFVIKAKEQATTLKDEDADPDTDEQLKEDPTLREHFDEDEDDLPTDERVAYSELDQDDYETVIEPSVVLDALKDSSSTGHNESEEDLDTDVLDILESDEDALSNAVASGAEDHQHNSDIDGFEAATVAAYAELQEEEESKSAPNNNSQEESPSSKRTSFSIQVLSPNETEEEEDSFSDDDNTDDDNTNDDNTDEDETDTPTNPVGPPPDPREPASASNPSQRESPATPIQPENHAFRPPPLPSNSPPQTKRPLFWLAALFVIIVLGIYSFKAYSDRTDSQTVEPPAVPAVPQQ